MRIGDPDRGQGQWLRTTAVVTALWPRTTVVVTGLWRAPWI